MTEPADGGGTRAWLQVGGIAVARLHLALALALGCERVVCVAPAFEARMGALQHVAEAAGASFHVITGARGLIGMVSAADEVLALGDGLLAAPDIVTTQLSGGPCVLVQPVESGLALGFERLDLNHAAAAAMLVPGRLVERLGELPADVDGFSALQRIALQAGVGQRLLPGEAHEGGRWTLLRSEAEAHAAESGWIRLHTLTSGGNAPSLAVARRVVRAFGPALLHAGSSGTPVAMAAGVLALLGLAAGWFGLPAAAFCFCAGGWVLFVAAALLARVERQSLLLPRPPLDLAVAFAAAMDAVLALLLAWNAAPGQGLAQRAFAPLVLLGLARLVALLGPGGWERWLEDRAVLAMVLALAAFLGVLGAAVPLLALALLGLGLAVAGRRPARG